MNEFRVTDAVKRFSIIDVSRGNAILPPSGFNSMPPEPNLEARCVHFPPVDAPISRQPKRLVLLRNATVRYSAALAIVGTPTCPSISPFVRLSVTLENCVKTAEPIVMVPAPNRTVA